MIDKAIAAALTRIQTDVNALNVIVTTSEHWREMPTEIPALQDNVARLWNDVHYLKTLDFNALQRPIEDRNTPQKVAENDTNAETEEEIETTPEELTARQKEQYIFERLTN